MTTYFPDLIGQGQCVYGCRDARKGHICTGATEVADTGNQSAICPPTSDCDDAVMHRTADRDWHACNGTTPERWWAQREEPQLPLEVKG